MNTIDQMHRVARLDQAILRWRADWATRHGYRPAVIAYTGYGSPRWVRVLARVVYSRRGVIFRGDPTGSRGWRSFILVPVADAEIDVELNGVHHTVRADHGGVVDVVVEQEMTPGRHTITMSANGSPPVSADVFVLGDEEQFGIISDIDDTVMVTALPRPLLAAWHTFVVNEHARAATPGMPVLYERLSDAHHAPPVDGRLERGPDADAFPVQQPVSARGAAADRLGADRGSLVPQRQGAQAGQPATLGDRVPADQVAAVRRRRPARRDAVSRVRGRPPRPGRGRLHPPADPR
jgi:hypothetical protein